MKVGILTYHNTANYGAALQAYATQAFLVSLGEDAEIIDYTNEYRFGSYSVIKRFLKQIREGQLLQAIKTLIGMPMILKRIKNFNAFYSSYLNTSSSVFRTIKSLKENSPNYDVYLVGSDQVWNYRNNGCDINYMLDFVSDKSKTISYASSFGVEAIPNGLRDKYARPLSEIRAISVREKMGSVLVNQLTGRKAEIVLDPVFLPKKSHWYEIAKDIDIGNQPYVLVYTNKSDYFSKFQTITKFEPGIRDIVKIGSDISLTDLFNQQIRIRSTIGPEGFLGFIKNADFVLTSSFHGTAFSILMEKPFIVFLSGDKGRDFRIVDLLSSLGLSDRIFNSNTSWDKVECNINYQAVNERLSALRKQSISFLFNALQKIYID
jgi:hypothetical protein